MDESYFDSLFEDEEDDEDFSSILKKQSVSSIESNKQLDQMSEIGFF